MALWDLGLALLEVQSPLWPLSQFLHSQALQIAQTFATPAATEGQLSYAVI